MSSLTACGWKNVLKLETRVGEILGAFLVNAFSEQIPFNQICTFWSLSVSCKASMVATVWGRPFPVSTEKCPHVQSSLAWRNLTGLQRGLTSTLSNTFGMNCLIDNKTYKLS